MRTITRTTKRYDAILCADLHVREDTPICRDREEYLASQERKLLFIQKLCAENTCPLLCAGDLWDHWKPSPWLMSLALRCLPPLTITVIGQHDTVGHSLAPSELAKTGLETLKTAGRVIVLSNGLQHVVGRSTRCFGYSWGEKAINPPDDGVKGKKLLLWHVMTCENKQPFPGACAILANTLDKWKYDLVITGDNHLQFQKGKVLNPGSLCRMSSDQADFEPAVFGWGEDGIVTRIPLPIERGVVKATTSNAKAKESRDKRMESYIKKASAQFETRLSFTKNLEQHFKTNKERDGVEKIVWKACETNEK
jgi:hypothetical protein